MSCDPPASSVQGILQARTLEWVAILFSEGISPTPGLKLGSPALQADFLPSEPPLFKTLVTGYYSLCM